MKIIVVHYHIKLAKTTHNFMLTMWLRKQCSVWTLLSNEKDVVNTEEEKKNCQMSLYRLFVFRLFKQTIHYKCIEYRHFYRFCDDQPFPWNIYSIFGNSCSTQLTHRPRERKRVNWTAVAAEWWEISQKWKALRSCVIDTNYLNAERFTIRQNRWNEVKHPDNCLYRHVKAFLSHFKTVFIALARSPSLFHSAVISFSAVLFSICFINNLLHSVLDLEDDMLV